MSKNPILENSFSTKNGEERSAPEVTTPNSSLPVTNHQLVQSSKRGNRIWTSIAVLTILLAITAFVLTRSTPVTTIKTESTTMAETIASSGIVQGHVEATVGAQVQGILTKVFVEEGTVVMKDQLLAQVQNNLAEQQVEQAKSQLATALAVVAQVSAKPKQSEIASARSRVSQTQAGLNQQTAMANKADVGRSLALANFRQAEVGVERAESALKQAQTQLDLAEKTLTRKKTLVLAGAIPLTEQELAQANFDIAQQGVTTATSTVTQAKLSLDTAKDQIKSSEQDYNSARSLMAAAVAQLNAAKSDLQTLLAKPRAEDIEVAKKKVIEAQNALVIATTLVKNSNIFAPFAGTVTSIIAQPGSNPAATGVLKLVQTEKLEIKLDLDEANLKNVHIGQRALITAPVGREKEVTGHVVRIGSQIDSQRGTLEVFVSTDEPEAWLRPGQTLNVNVVTEENAHRILVPTTAVQRTGDQTVVYVVQDGRAVRTSVTLGLASGDKVVVLRGLADHQIVVNNPSQMVNNQRVKASK